MLKKTLLEESAPWRRRFLTSVLLDAQMARENPTRGIVISNNTKEFKMEAVRLAETSGKPITELARELRVSDSTIHNWCKQLGEHGEQAFPGSGHQTVQEEELRRLKRELEVVKQERDIF
ncbi:transposase [Ktedonobacter robiniae]|uniref:Transposase n=1 Tax=Ktedonobacter robiniae TaxID=2778365 RepID=A0ABQ3UY96_9CHLR|nr:transposase [Ktedonobacter robiniae]GHO57859.1 hypothetical protein KSB_63340 [Ktedonobacter robiniae]